MQATGAARLRVLAKHLQDHEIGAKDISAAHSRAEIPRDRDSKIASAGQAVESIPDGATITVGGFVGCGMPELLVNAVRERFDSTGHPRGLHLLQVATVGDGKGRGMDRLAVEGLVTKYTYGWTGLSPGYARLITQGKMLAWNLPLGVISHTIRDVAAKRPGPITHIGLGTFVDPREQGGKVTDPSQPDAVHLMRVGDRELLWYPAPRSIDVALVRGTTADLDGNVSMEHEPFYADQMYQAMAAHNSGGLVIVQVERVVERGCIPARSVHVPGAFVDKVVVAPPELHWQSLGSPAYDGSLCGEVRTPEGHMQPMPLSGRRVIAHRAMLAISVPHAIINLGVGMPEGVAQAVGTHARTQNPGCLPLTLTTEVGIVGGFPAGGLRFGAACNAVAALPLASMLDFYNGGGADVACLGMAEVDQEGNVNVSRFEGRMPGCGGFIDISSTAKQVLFLGTFTSGGLQVAVREGKLHVEKEGTVRKFRKQVFEKTFAAASSEGRSIMYITERAVLKLQGPSGGLELLEIAPGIDLDRDVLGQMDFQPIMKTSPLKLMDVRCFQP